MLLTVENKVLIYLIGEHENVMGLGKIGYDLKLVPGKDLARRVGRSIQYHGPSPA